MKRRAANLLPSLMLTAILATACSGGGDQPGSKAPAAKPVVAQAAAATPADAVGAGMAALAKAAAADRYLFLLFYKNKGGRTAELRGVFDRAVEKVRDRADALTVWVGDPEEKEIVGKFRAGRAPLPLVLAVAPNGAVTRGLYKDFTEEQITGACASSCTEKCLKTIQENKLAFLCIQNGSTAHREEALAGVKAFQNDPQFGRRTDLVLLDPADPDEGPFLEQLKVKPDPKEAVTLLLAPPGGVLARFDGATDKEMILAAVKRASSSSCGPNASPGCCSKPAAGK